MYCRASTPIPPLRPSAAIGAKAAYSSNAKRARPEESNSTATAIIQINANAALSGRARIEGPDPDIELRLIPLVIPFFDRHQGVCIEMISQGELVNVIAAGVDADVRYNETHEQDVVAVRLGELAE